MKQSYPVILISVKEGGYVVDVPDFTIGTQGKNITEAIEMARDAISLTGVSMEDRGIPLPEPTPVKNVLTESSNDVVTLVDVDFVAYRRIVDSKVVKKNCTIPSWLNADAERAGVNFSAILQKGLKEELGIS